VEALGRVAHVYAPSTFHHRWVGEARLHAPAAPAEKRRELRVDRTLGAAPEPAFAGVVDELHVDGFRLDETVLVHRPSRTLVVADLVHHVGRPEGAWTRLYARTMGSYDRVALSRMLRWIAFSDRAAARKSVDAVLAQPFERLVVAHGAPLPAGAHKALAAAYAWLS
ncbi:MAG TPA: hypothetical protein VGL86_02440, partial [Polyangia bacterium]